MSDHKKFLTATLEAIRKAKETVAVNAHKYPESQGVQVDAKAIADELTDLYKRIQNTIDTLQH